jgi:hypothetical protein
MDKEPQPSTSRGLNDRSKRIRRPNQKYLDDYISDVTDVSEKLPRKIKKTEIQSNFSEESETPPEIGSILRKGIKFKDSEEWLEFKQDRSNQRCVELQVFVLSYGFMQFFKNSEQ